MSLLRLIKSISLHLWDILTRGWNKYLSLLVAAIGLYDLALSQIVSDGLAGELPKIRALIPVYVWPYIILSVLCLELFIESFRRSHQKSNIIAAILRLNYNGIRENFEIHGSTNVYAAERREDGSWEVQFERSIDPGTLTARVPDGEDVSLELTAFGRKRARVSFDHPQPLTHLLRAHPL
ncbi:MAG TPA: hypothetical protein VKA94_15405, partial [Hyphomicrobiales bacterium]|nr:hypothetical protein [Hyphomicrobiales bacterium]